MDKESFTKGELNKNKESAYTADAASYAASYASYAADADADDADDTIDCWIDMYFKRTGENKQDYIDEIKRVKESVKEKALEYTQAMADNGELPPIGSKVQFVGNDDYLVEFGIVDGDEIECICHTTDFEGESIGVYRHKDGYSVSILTQLVEPLAPPITLIDGKAYQFDIDSLVISGIYRKMDNKFYNYNGDFGVEYCTNIQPLTVEVK